MLSFRPLVHLFALLTLLPALGRAQPIDIVTAPGDPLLYGMGGNSASYNQSSRNLLSADGQRVVFISWAANLVAGDDNHLPDAFLRDRATARTRLLSRSADGRSGNGATETVAISADGRVVAFASEADDLVAGDGNGRRDMFVYLIDEDRLELISRGHNGGAANGDSSEPSLSADGRFIAFTSGASNLVAGDGNGFNDIFVHDRLDGSTRRISLPAAGDEANGHTSLPSLAADGSLICYLSRASNLSGATVATMLRDLGSGQTRVVSRMPDGSPRNGGSCSIALPRNEVVFDSTANDMVGDGGRFSRQMFAFNMSTEQVTRLAVAGGGELPLGGVQHTLASADGARIVFTGSSTNLPAPASPQLLHTYVYDRERDRVDALANAMETEFGSYSPSLSADGRVAVFTAGDALQADDRNGTSDIYARALDGGAPQLISLADSPQPAGAGGYEGAISADGRYSVFVSYAKLTDTTPRFDQLYLYDAQTRAHTLLSLGVDGEPADANCSRPSISDDGRYIAYVSQASNLVAGFNLPASTNQVYLHDRVLGSTVLVSAANGLAGNAASSLPTISADGRRIAFPSQASNLVADATPQNSYRLLLWQRDDASLRRIDLTAEGALPNQALNVRAPGLSADGRYAVFASRASNYVANDGNDRLDVFRKDIDSGDVLLVSRREDGVPGNGNSLDPSLSADGSVVAFLSDASDLTVDDVAARTDVFVRDLTAATTQRLSNDAVAAQAGAIPVGPKLSADGRLVVFASTIPSLVPGDGNGSSDVFIVDRRIGRPQRLSLDPSGQEYVADAYEPRLSADGRRVLYAVYPLPFSLPGRRASPAEVDLVLSSHAAYRVFADGFD